SGGLAQTRPQAAGFALPASGVPAQSQAAAPQCPSFAMRPQSQALVVCHATAVAGRPMGGRDQMLSTTVGDSVRSYQTALQQALSRVSADIMSQIALDILAAYDRDGRTFVFGNGGSAATAS